MSDGCEFRGSGRLASTDAHQRRHQEPWTGLDGLAQVLGERATLLQFSSAFCAPCRATRRILSDVAGIVPGVAHLELDAEKHLDLVRQLGIVRTPTTLVLDARGHEVSRAGGAPTRSAVLATLGDALDQHVQDSDGTSSV